MQGEYDIEIKGTDQSGGDLLCVQAKCPVEWSKKAFLNLTDLQRTLKCTHERVVKLLTLNACVCAAIKFIYYYFTEAVLHTKWSDYRNSESGTGLKHQQMCTVYVVWNHVTSLADLRIHISKIMAWRSAIFMYHGLLILIFFCLRFHPMFTLTSLLPK